MASFSEGFGRIAGDGVEAPGAVAGGGVIGIEEAADGMVAAGDADHHLAVGDARRHGDGVPILRIGHARFPDHLAGEGVQRFQAPVDHGREDHAVIDREAAVDDAAAELGTDGGLIHFRIPAPEFLAGAGIQRRTRRSKW